MNGNDFAYFHTLRRPWKMEKRLFGYFRGSYPEKTCRNLQFGLYNGNVNIFHLAAKDYRLHQVAFPLTSVFNSFGETSWGATSKTGQIGLIWFSLHFRKPQNHKGKPENRDSFNSRELLKLIQDNVTLLGMGVDRVQHRSNCSNMHGTLLRTPVIFDSQTNVNRCTAV